MKPLMITLVSVLCLALLPALSSALECSGAPAEYVCTCPAGQEKYVNGFGRFACVVQPAGYSLPISTIGGLVPYAEYKVGFPCVSPYYIDFPAGILQNPILPGTMTDTVDCMYATSSGGSRYVWTITFDPSSGYVVSKVVDFQMIPQQPAQPAMDTALGRLIADIRSWLCNNIHIWC